MVVFYGLFNFLLVIGTGTTRRQPRVVPGYNARNFTQASNYTHKLAYCLSLIRHFVVMIKKWPRLSYLFEDAKCRLLTENDTRWGSNYLQLEMTHKAYERNYFYLFSAIHINWILYFKLFTVQSAVWSPLYNHL